ncbi:hypothetical protein [Chitinimonas sp.]|uniref:hypothetical protein n=1 Tax=Chitinimonas sp. TaxID=1934313 RepID=UPI0035AF1647
MMTHDYQSRFWIGVGLFTFQAGQSLDRAHGDFGCDELRDFYNGRTDPVQVAEAVINAEPYLGPFEWARLRRRSIPTVDAYITARLLFDFSLVLRGDEDRSPLARGCLRYCLTTNALKILAVFNMTRSKELEELNWYNKSNLIGTVRELTDLVGEDWFKT